MNTTPTNESPLMVPARQLRTRTSKSYVAMSAVLMGLMPLVLGVTECEEATPTPVCDTGCSSGEIVLCGDQCAAPLKKGEECDPDPCVSVCETGLTCSGNSADGFFCNDGETLMEECDFPGAGPGFDDCANNLFCRENDECPDYPFGFPAASCFPPVTEEGFHCDSDFDDPRCFPCAPGLVCTATGSADVCLRACTVDTDCGCDGGTPGDCNGGRCRECVGAGDECNAFLQCCDGISTCAGQHQAGFKYCCLDADEQLECGATADCCPGSICAKENVDGPKVCQTCKRTGEGCVLDAQCCGGAQCRDGICSECDPNSSCDTGLPGICQTGDSECSNGEFVGCTAPSPQTELCDGADSNCNGVEDEFDPDIAGVGAPCTATVFVDPDGDPIGSCHSGFAPQGFGACDPDEGVQCQAIVCGTCGDACGGCVGSGCDAQHPCMPEAFCDQGTCVFAAACESPFPNQCWELEDVGSCLQ